MPDRSTPKSITRLVRRGRNRAEIAAGYLVLLLFVGAGTMHEWRVHHTPVSTRPLIIAAFAIVAAIGWTVWNRRIAAEMNSARSTHRLLEHIPAAAYIAAHGDANPLVYISPRIESMIGVTVQDCLATRSFFYDRMHPDDKDRVLAEDRRTDTTGDRFQVEYRLLTGDGRYRWFRDEAVLIADERSGERYWQGVLVDVTDRKQTETSLQLALAAAKMGTWDWDLTTGDLLWSHESEQLHGLDPGGFNGAYDDFLANLHPEDRPRVEAAVAASLTAGEDYEVEYRIVDAADKITWEYVKGIVVRDAAGAPLRMTGVAADITARKEAESILRRSEERFRALVQNTFDILLITDPDGVVRYASPSVERIMGHRPADIIDQLSHPRHHPEDTARARAAWAELLAHPDRSVQYEMRSRHADGSWRWIEVRGTNHLATPGIGGFVFNARDITERRENERHLREAETKYRTLVEQIAAVIYVDVADGPLRTTRYISPQLERLLGYTPEEWVSDPTLWAARLHPDDRERLLAETARTTAGAEPFTAEYRFLARSGRVVWVRDDAIPVRDERTGAVAWHGLVQDITERKSLEAQLAHQAFHDALTGLPNRALFTDRLDHALRAADRRGEPIAVLFLDLDRFKLVNDSLGHEAGDRLLIEASERIAGCLRAADTIARFGGDEFAILLNNAGDDDARRVADRILAALRVPMLIAGQEIFTTASIGITTTTAPALASMNGSHDQRAPGDLLRAADIALYQAKHAGRATSVAYEPGMAVQSSTWLALEADLRRAIDRSELTLHYQPIVDLVTGETRSVETLLRWRHPARGVLAPAAFLPLAEETGLISVIGARVIEDACRQLGEWKRALPAAPATIDVNLSARQLRDPGLVQRVMAALAAADLPPSSLRLEISEDALVADLRATAASLRALSDLGVRLAIDDFGAGASSLASLRELTVDTLKLDRSFIRPIDRGPNDESLVAAIVALAHRLGVCVTAEGIETERQLAAVRRAGCDTGQGFLFGRPIAAEPMTAFLRAAAAGPGPGRAERDDARAWAELALPAD